MTEGSKERRQVINLYAAFGVALILSLVPSVAVALIALLFITGVLVAAYYLRRKAAEESLLENHTIFIIRTIWISALISVVTIAAGSAYMIPRIDHVAFGPCANALAQKGPEYAQTASFEEVYKAAEPCMEAFLDMNYRLMMGTAIMMALPIIFYLLFRYGRGLSRAIKGYRIANPKGWL